MRLGYAHAQLSSLYLLSTLNGFGAFHVTKNTRLSTPAQLQCSRSGAWERGYLGTRLGSLVPMPRPHPRGEWVWGRDYLQVACPVNVYAQEFSQEAGRVLTNRDVAVLRSNIDSICETVCKESPGRYHLFCNQK